MNACNLAVSVLASVMLLSMPAKADPLGGTYLPEHEPLLQEVATKWSGLCDKAQSGFADANGVAPQSGNMRLEWPDDIYLMEYSPGKMASVITMGAFACDNIGHMGGAFGGNSGSDFYVVAEGKLFSGFGYNPFSITRTEENGFQEVLVLFPHRGFTCQGDTDYALSGSSPCYSVAVWDQYAKAFNSVDGVLNEVEAIR
jgi:hypothetical protein